MCCYKMEVLMAAIYIQIHTISNFNFSITRRIKFCPPKTSFQTVFYSQRKAWTCHFLPVHSSLYIGGSHSKERKTLNSKPWRSWCETNKPFLLRNYSKSWIIRKHLWRFLIDYVLKEHGIHKIKLLNNQTNNAGNVYTH